MSSMMSYLTTLSLCVVCALAATGSPSAGVMSTAVKELKAKLTTCIDDSDCQKLGQGNKYACFKYICYPWQDDSEVDVAERKQTCRKTKDCDSVDGQEMTCIRHHDRRGVTKGLCFADELSGDCDENEECADGYGCCAGSCCEQEYYNKFTDLPCVTHLGCSDLGLGKFCCPSKTNGTDSKCCNEDPNPPPPTESPSLSMTASAHALSVAMVNMVAAVVLAKLL